MILLTHALDPQEAQRPLGSRASHLFPIIGIHNDSVRCAFLLLSLVNNIPVFSRLSFHFKGILKSTPNLLCTDVPASGMWPADRKKKKYCFTTQISTKKIIIAVLRTAP